MVSYSISAPERPWVVLFSSPSLAAVAEALAAQAEVDPAAVYASLDGKTRSLNEAERIEMLEQVLELQPGNAVAAVALAAARVVRGSGSEA